MPTEVIITNITGQTPYDIYLCQSGGTGCFYIDTSSTSSFTFQIPEPYDNAIAYTIKIIDNNGCIIEKTSSV